jgi:hypothetical protein
MKPASDTHLQTWVPAPDMPGTATAPGYASTFPGRADQLSQVRRDITPYLHNCPAADDLILITDELAANAILHTQSRGASFTVRCRLSHRAARIEVEDLGGPWRPRNPGDRPHGLDIIAALTGPDAWGTQPAGTGGRTVWARLTW